MEAVTHLPTQTAILTPHKLITERSLVLDWSITCYVSSFSVHCPVKGTYASTNPARQYGNRFNLQTRDIPGVS